EGGACSGLAGSVWHDALATIASWTAIAIAAARDRTRIRPLTAIASLTESTGRPGLQQHLLVLGVYPELHGLTIGSPSDDRHLACDLAREGLVSQRPLIPRGTAGPQGARR